MKDLILGKLYTKEQLFEDYRLMSDGLKVSDYVIFNDKKHCYFFETLSNDILKLYKKELK